MISDSAAILVSQFLILFEIKRLARFVDSKLFEIQNVFFQPDLKASLKMEPLVQLYI